MSRVKAQTNHDVSSLEPRSGEAFTAIWKRLLPNVGIWGAYRTMTEAEKVGSTAVFGLGVFSWMLDLGSGIKRCVTLLVQCDLIRQRYY
jgi:hypothetical protein